MADGELELSAEAGTPALAQLLGVSAKVGVRYRRTAHARGERLVDQICAETGLTLAELEAKLDEGEELRDIFMAAGARAVTVANEDYRDTIAHLVVAAMDDAKIDEAACLFAQVAKLEPLHLRVLRMCVEVESDETKVATDHSLAAELGVSKGLAEAIVDVLQSAGFVERFKLVEDGQIFAEDHRWEDSSAVRLTMWGYEATSLLFPEQLLDLRWDQ